MIQLSPRRSAAATGILLLLSRCEGPWCPLVGWKVEMRVGFVYLRPQSTGFKPGLVPADEELCYLIAIFGLMVVGFVCTLLGIFGYEHGTTPNVVSMLLVALVTVLWLP